MTMDDESPFGDTPEQAKTKSRLWEILCDAEMSEVLRMLADLTATLSDNSMQASEPTRAIRWEYAQDAILEAARTAHRAELNASEPALRDRR